MIKNLPRSYKNRYPFRLAATSFIYPADYATNVRRLGPYVDEIELLLFESRPDALPDAVEIAILVELASEFNLTYNVHLPIDTYLCDPKTDRKREAARALKDVIDRTAPLSPTTHTLHLTYDGSPRKTWQHSAEQGVAMLLAQDVNSRCLSIETLDYPFEWVADIIDAHDLSVCIDLGHLIVHERDVTAILDHFCDRTVIIHFHGVDGKSDHLPLNRLSPSVYRPILDRLRRFKGSVSLEVFSFDHLVASLDTLALWWRDGAIEVMQPET